MTEHEDTAPADKEDVAETLAKPEKAKAAKRAPRRVPMHHPKMKGQARPFENELAPWLAAGWVRGSAGNAE